jgi:hypothetical protein
MKLLPQRPASKEAQQRPPRLAGRRPVAFRRAARYVPCNGAYTSRVQGAFGEGRKGPDSFPTFPPIQQDHGLSRGNNTRSLRMALAAQSGPRFYRTRKSSRYRATGHATHAVFRYCHRSKRPWPSSRVGSPSSLAIDHPVGPERVLRALSHSIPAWAADQRPSFSGQPSAAAPPAAPSYTWEGAPDEPDSRTHDPAAGGAGRGPGRPRFRCGGQRPARSRRCGQRLNSFYGTRRAHATSYRRARGVDGATGSGRLFAW